MEEEISEMWEGQDLFRRFDGQRTDFHMDMYDEFKDGILSHHVKVVNKFGRYCSDYECIRNTILFRELAARACHERFVRDYRVQNIPYGPIIHVVHKAFDSSLEEVYCSKFSIVLEGYVEPEHLVELFMEEMEFLESVLNKRSN